VGVVPAVTSVTDVQPASAVLANGTLSANETVPANPVVPRTPDRKETVAVNVIVAPFVSVLAVRDVVITVFVMPVARLRGNAAGVAAANQVFPGYEAVIETDDPDAKDVRHDAVQTFVAPICVRGTVAQLAIDPPVKLIVVDWADERAGADAGDVCWVRTEVAGMIPTVKVAVRVTPVFRAAGLLSALSVRVVVSGFTVCANTVLVT
jgi:hypothetical protein